MSSLVTLPASPTPPRNRPSDRADVEAWRQSLVGAHFGVIEALERVPLEADDLPLAVYAGRLCRTSAWAAVDAPRAASGAALDDTDALAACIGEAVERYSAALVAPRMCHYERADRLPGDVATPGCFPLFSQRQYRQSRKLFPFEPWDPQRRLSWVRADRLTGDGQLWVPAVFVHQPFLPHHDEPFIAPSLSTGLACGRDADSATIAAVCEVIERDAVALAWLGRIRPRRIDFSGRDGDDSLATLVHGLNARGFRWSAFDLTTDLRVPVVAALIEGESSLGRIVSFGSACRLDPVHAARKALVEAAHCRMYVKSLLREQPDWNAGRKLRNVTTFADHARFYTTHPQYRNALDQWWNTPHVTRLDESLCHATFLPLPPAGEGPGVRGRTSPDIADTSCHAKPTRSQSPEHTATLRALLSRISAAGCEALRVDLTPPDLAPLGLCIVRALIPGLQPLHGNHAWPHLAGPRLRTLRTIFGPHTRQPWRWNPYPHPCP